MITRSQKYVGIEILRTDTYGNAKSQYEIFEREILSEVSNVSRHSTHEGRHYVLPAWDEFTHHGPNREHICFVFDVISHHLGHQAFHFKGKRLPVKAVRSISRQILLGLDFLHTECGIVHTGMASNPKSQRI